VPLIKQIRGLPGDAFVFMPATDERGFRLLVNGETLANSAGEPYLITGRTIFTMVGEGKPYGSHVPPDHYLILGDQPHGSMDSTHIGFVSRAQLIAKVAE
jgi:signal peptidase I